MSPGRVMRALPPCPPVCPPLHAAPRATPVRYAASTPARPSLEVARTPGRDVRVVVAELCPEPTQEAITPCAPLPLACCPPNYISPLSGTCLAELLPGLVQRLLQLIRLQHHGVPLILEVRQKPRDARRRRRPRRHRLVRLYSDEVLLGEVPTRRRTLALRVDVLLRQGALEEMARADRHHRVRRHLPADRAEHGGACLIERPQNI